MTLPDSDKTQAQLIAELEALRSEVARLTQPSSIAQRLASSDQLTRPQQAPEHNIGQQAALLRQDACTDCGQAALQAEAALRLSEERYRYLVAATAEVIWTTDAQGYVIQASDSWCELTGQPWAEAQGWGWLDCVHPHDRERVRQSWLRALGDKTLFEIEYRVRAIDGSYRDFWVRGVPLFDPNGTVREWIGTHTNITERKRAEVALVESNQQITQILESITDAFFALDSTWQFTYLNPKAEQLLQRNREDLLGKSVWVEFPEAVHSVFYQQFQKVMTEQVIAAFEEFYAPLSTWFEVRAYPTQGGLSVYFRNVTARKHVELELKRAKTELEIRVAARTAELSQANLRLMQELMERQQVEAALRQSEAKFRSLCECSPIGIFMLDADGQCIYINPCGQEICGCTFEEALGNGWVNTLHPEIRDTVLAQRSQALANTQPFRVAERYLHQDGSIRHGQIQMVPILAANGDLVSYVGTIEDVTEQQAMETMKSEFVSIVSHELRTPLSSIRGSLGLLASGALRHNPDTAQQMLEIASSETERLVRLVNDILDLERLESNTITLNYAWIDCASLMRQTIEALQPLADANQIGLALTPLNCQVWGDGDRIMQTLVNLLSNAIKFSPAASTVTLTAQLKHTERSPHIQFQIQDQGRGIPASQREKIFERFQQVDASDSRHKGGTGLGLTICRSIVQQHGGAIWVESTLEKGSTFYFTLPMHRES